METTLQDVRWIGGYPGSSRAPLLRREFRLGDGMLSAELRISGLGYYEAWINGQRVGDQVLDPGQTDYETRVFYVSHDVMSLLREGANALGVMLGNGWYNQNLVWSADMAYGVPRLWAELTVRMADGSSRVIRTDETWRCTDGPVVSNNIYAGETYDARLELPGWTSPGFADGTWRPVTLSEPPGGRLEPQPIPSIRRIEELKPVTLRELQPGIYRLRVFSLQFPLGEPMGEIPRRHRDQPGLERRPAGPHRAGPAALASGQPGLDGGLHPDPMVSLRPWW
jgi:alpha-L-rhamnosidase